MSGATATTRVRTTSPSTSKPSSPIKSPIVSPWADGFSSGQILPETDESGNIEYKLKLVSPSMERFEKLVTQLKWRLLEGNGEAIYELGVMDTGKLIGLNRYELQSSLTTLKRMAEKLDAKITILRQMQISKNVSGVVQISIIIGDEKSGIIIPNSIKANMRTILEIRVASKVNQHTMPVQEEILELDLAAFAKDI